jgi:bifunctional NMN adenylyltransferase/nudix hydrolase
MNTNVPSMTVFIGRFQPVHNGHIETIRTALTYSQGVLILIGSAFKPADTRNPFTHLERERMIRDCLTKSEQGRVAFDHISDNPYNELAWIKDVQRAVDSAYHNQYGWQDKPNISIIGFHKDATSYYLDLFPSWNQIETVNVHGLDSTFIRELYFQGVADWNYKNRKIVARSIPEEAIWHLDEMITHNTSKYNKLVKEFEFIRNYKLQWSQAPYPPTFVTADAVVTCLGHILLVQRKAAPGEGLWAMPGGFLNQNETVRECAVRELEEETKIKVPAPVLNGSIVKEKRYDYPARSLRGRTITTAFHINLLGERKLPKVKGSDDAANAKWVPLSEFIRSQNEMYEDHYHIITDLLGLG